MTSRASLRKWLQQGVLRAYVRPKTIPLNTWRVHLRGGAMTGYIRELCSKRIALNAIKISLVVGTLLNLINQGSALFSLSGIDVLHLALNYLVPYCVASYSAVKIERTRSDDEERK